MKLKLEWKQPIRLRAPNYVVDLSKIPQKPGIYIFLRTHGVTSEALYVGKTNNLRSRIKQQLNNHALIEGIRAAPNGARQLFFAEWRARSGQNAGAALPICEKTLIRYFLSLGHGLLNIQGRELKFHELESTRPALKRFLPAMTRMLI